ncbi:MAG: EthD family reductase [Geobacter sp.]|nr:EthD family reductase [Geobacter sp.]
MIKVSIIYPFQENGHFDFSYYISRHMPRSIELLSACQGFRNVTVEKGICGTEPDSAPDYVAACFYTFDTVESFVSAFMPHAEELQRDISNYTNISPKIQFNEILIQK